MAGKIALHSFQLLVLPLIKFRVFSVCHQRLHLQQTLLAYFAMVSMKLMVRGRNLGLSLNLVLSIVASVIDLFAEARSLSLRRVVSFNFVVLAL